MALVKPTPDRRRQLAVELRIDEQYVYQLCAGLKTASPALARRLNALEPTLTLQDLRPSDWREIWPELINTEGAPAVPALATATEASDV